MLFFRDTVLGDALGAGPQRAEITELSEEALMLVHGGLYGVPAATQANLTTSLIRFIFTRVLTDLAPAETRPPRDFSTGQMGRGGDSGGSGSGGAPGV